MPWGTQARPTSCARRSSSPGWPRSWSAWKRCGPPPPAGSTRIVDNPVDRPVPSPMEPRWEGELPPTDSLLALALARRPMLLAGAATVSAAGAGERLAGREIWPDLEVGLQYGWRPMEDGTEHMVSVMLGMRAADLGWEPAGVDAPRGDRHARDGHRGPSGHGGGDRGPGERAGRRRRPRAAPPNALPETRSCRRPRPPSALPWPPIGSEEWTS